MVPISEIQHEFISHKKACCCIPLSCSNSCMKGQMNERYTKCEDLRNLGGLAIDEDTGSPLVSYVDEGKGMDGVMLKVGSFV
jgi:hypothetical protein